MGLLAIWCSKAAISFRRWKFSLSNFSFGWLPLLDLVNPWLLELQKINVVQNRLVVSAHKLLDLEDVVFGLERHHRKSMLYFFGAIYEIFKVFVHFFYLSLFFLFLVRWQLKSFILFSFLFKAISILLEFALRLCCLRIICRSFFTNLLLCGVDVSVFYFPNSYFIKERLGLMRL